MPLGLIWIPPVNHSRIPTKQAPIDWHLPTTVSLPKDKSELAFYMRNLYNDLKANKKRIKNGEEALEVEWAMKYANLITVTPTDSKNSGPVFEAFAGKFMLDLKAYQDADKNGNLEIYNGMIQSCLNCHAQYCKGPMGAIRKLKM